MTTVVFKERVPRNGPTPGFTTGMREGGNQGGINNVQFYDETCKFKTLKFKELRRLLFARSSRIPGNVALNDVGDGVSSVYAALSAWQLEQMLLRVRGGDAFICALFDILTSLSPMKLPPLDKYDGVWSAQRGTKEHAKKMNALLGKSRNSKKKLAVPTTKEIEAEDEITLNTRLFGPAAEQEKQRIHYKTIRDLFLLGPTGPTVNSLLNNRASMRAIFTELSDAGITEVVAKQIKNMLMYQVYEVLYVNKPLTDSLDSIWSD